MSGNIINETIVLREHWREILEQAERQVNAQDLPRLPELPHGRYYLRERRRQDGSVVFTLVCAQGNTWIRVGSFVRGEGRVRAGLQTEGRIIELACGRQVQVAIETTGRFAGLPYPVPTEFAR